MRAVTKALRTQAPSATVLIRLAVGSVFFPKEFKKFLFPDRPNSLRERRPNSKHEGRTSENDRAACLIASPAHSCALPACQKTFDAVWKVGVYFPN